MKRPELRIDGGASAERRFEIPPSGLRLGRSSSNDIPVHDEELSRNHCLFEPVGESGIRLTDLASANGTFVNGVKLGAESAELKLGDVIRVGSTTITLVDDEAPSGGFDLGLGRPKTESPTVAAPQSERPLSTRAKVTGLLAAVAFASVLVLAWNFSESLFTNPPEAAASAAVTRTRAKPTLVEMRYEKVAADSQAIFRYYLTLDPDGTLRVVINDTSDNRQTDKKVRISDTSRDELMALFADEAFAALQPSYAGPADEPPKLASWSLVYFTPTTKQEVSIVNTLEPEAFRHVREKLETFAENELGIHAWHYSREDLMKMAHEKADTARMKWEDRDVEYANVHAAICAYDEAITYLETLNPKPPEFETYRAARERATRELDARYKNQRFAAEQAMSTGDWEKAKRELTTIRDMIPDAKDDRNHEATLKLIDIDRRLGRKGGRK